MTRARRALLVAEAAYAEAVAVRDPLAIAAAAAEYEDAHRRVTRQEGGRDRV